VPLTWPQRAAVQPPVQTPSSPGCWAWCLHRLLHWQTRSGSWRGSGWRWGRHWRLVMLTWRGGRQQSGRQSGAWHVNRWGGRLRERGDAVYGIEERGRGDGGC
jgi:hypothetical protein